MSNYIINSRWFWNILDTPTYKIIILLHFFQNCNFLFYVNFSFVAFFLIYSISRKKIFFLSKLQFFVKTAIFSQNWNFSFKLSEDLDSQKNEQKEINILMKYEYL